METVKSGLCQRVSDGEIFHYCQNEAEQRMGFAILTAVEPAEIFKISDLNCALSGLPFGAKIVKSLGLVDINYGFKILS